MNEGKVASVELGGIAEEAGIEPGDLIVSINGHALSDIIDYRYYSAEEFVDILVRRGSEEAVISVEKDIDEPLGIEFEDNLFDGVRECGNRCIFCFVHQLPKGMRRSLYLRDDDFRLSFLVGNFVTLTNVSDADIERIIEQHLSPLYVSVHATDPSLRRNLVRKPDLPNITDQLKRLADGKITLHTQIVICRGVNDGAQLERTVRDLAELYPQVASIGIVPVGLTKHRQVGPDIQSVDPVGAGEIIHAVNGWQKGFLRALGTRLVWASDELYLNAGVKVPSAASYEGYPQIENGIGLVRQFLVDTKRLAGRLPERLPHPLSATIVTSTLAAPLLEDFSAVLNRVENLEVRVAPIRNEFFGESVTVAGLVTGGDILKQLQTLDLGDLLVIPSTMLRDDTFLDDITIDRVSEELSVPVIGVSPKPSALLTALVDFAAG